MATAAQKTVPDIKPVTHGQRKKVSQNTNIAAGNPALLSKGVNRVRKTVALGVMEIYCNLSTIDIV